MATLRADISFTDGSTTKFIDVSTVDPTCPSVNPGGTAAAQGFAAKAREIRKLAVYAQTDAGEQGLLIPFVVETTGRLGPAAMKLIDSLSFNNTLARSQFLTAVSSTVAVFNARMLDHTRQQGAAVHRGYNE